MSPLGLNPASVVSAVLEGRSNFSPPPFRSSHFSGRRVALVENFDPRAFISPSRAVRFMSRETQFAVAALDLCLSDLSGRTGFKKGDSAAGNPACPWADPYEIALFAGTGSSGISLDDIMPMLGNSCNPDTGRFDPLIFSKQGLKKLNPLISFRILPNMPPSAAVIHGGVKGENLIFNPWEGSAMSGFREGIHALAEKRSRLVICGGSDCKTHSDAFIAFEEYGFFKSGPFVMSEGGAYLAMYLEEPGRPQVLHPYCRVAGMASMTVCGCTLAAPMNENMCEGIMEEALGSAAILASDVDIVLSSQDFSSQDRDEAAAINRIFPRARVLHPRKFLGNAIAAAGHFSLSIGSAILDSSEKGLSALRRIMVNSFGFGSEKHCVILEKP